jgi:hypothetical protein
MSVSVGDRFGRLTAVKPVKIAGRRGTFWLCRCDCGKTTTKYAGHIRAGQAKSCGCVKGARRTHSMSGTPEYKAWDNARARCYNKNNKRYPLYGARGIYMCEQWRWSFATFLADMGRRPSPQHSLDRRDNNGHYSPENCRWATDEEQNNNRSFNRHITIGGMTMTVAQASRLTGLTHATILSRLDAGKSDEEAVSCPGR